jgi:hypothetical protein
LGERLNGIQEVVSSILIGSTNHTADFEAGATRAGFFAIRA